MPRLEKREVLEIIIERNLRREAHRFILHSNGASFGDLDFIDRQFDLMELLLTMKFPDKKYDIKAYGLVESVNIVKM